MPFHTSKILYRRNIEKKGVRQKENQTENEKTSKLCECNRLLHEKKCLKSSNILFLSLSESQLFLRTRSHFTLARVVKICCLEKCCPLFSVSQFGVTSFSGAFIMQFLSFLSTADAESGLRGTKGEETGPAVALRWLEARHLMSWWLRLTLSNVILATAFTCGKTRAHRD